MPRTLPLTKKSLLMIGDGSQTDLCTLVSLWLYYQNQADNAMPSLFPGVASAELEALSDSPTPTPNRTRASTDADVTFAEFLEEEARKLGGLDDDDEEVLKTPHHTRASSFDPGPSDLA